MKHILTFLLMWSVPCYAEIISWECFGDIPTSIFQNYTSLCRIKVINGWLIKERGFSQLIFVPDSEHIWKL